MRYENPGLAYPFLTPVFGVPNYVETSLVVGTEDVRYHHIILGQPYL